MGETAPVRYRDQDNQPNSAGLVVQLVGIVAVLVLAIVGLGAVIIVAIGPGDDDEGDESSTAQPSTVDYTAGADLATALGCANTQSVDAAAHVEPDPSVAAPDAFQCTVGDRPVFGYVYLDASARESALGAGRLSVNLCTSFPADVTQPGAPTGFESVVGSNWLLATRDAGFADELNQQLGAGGLRQEISCVLEG